MKSESSGAKARLIQMAFLAIMIGVWWEIGRTRSISPLFLPPLGAVAEAVAALVRTATFWSSVRITLTSVGEAFAIAGCVGTLIGYGVTRSSFVQELLEPVLTGLFAVPITLFFPLFILFFGLGPASKVAYGASYAVFPVALNTIAALSSVDERHLRAARAMGVSRFGIIRHILWPASFPTILAGLRVSFFICFASVLGGETISSISGIGHNISLEAELMEPAKMYAWIAFVVLTALAMNAIASLIEERRAAAG